MKVPKRPVSRPPGGVRIERAVTSVCRASLAVKGSRRRVAPENIHLFTVKMEYFASFPKIVR